MTYKQIQALHETRMWVQLIVSIASGVVSAIIIDELYPNIKYKVKDTVVKPFKAVKEKFGKKAN